jgi:hypothetical protein
MALQPIDLQTLFVRLSTVGREQSAMKQAVAQNQLVAGEEIAQRSQDLRHTVRETDEVSEGPETVSDDQSGQKQNAGEKEKQAHHEEEQAGDDEVFRDPDLGHFVDLSG